MGMHCVVFHYPGPNWQDEFDFRNQPGIIEHVEHYSKLMESGKLRMGGPFSDADSGGMMIAEEGVSMEEIEKFASDDPAVKKGLLTFKVRLWYVPMSK